jgi:hypothetical protein
MTAAVSGLSEALGAPERECGSCMLCCKVYNVAALGKPAGKWCSLCEPGRGCTIHDRLPSECAAFNCLWKTMPALPMHWKPDQSKMVLTVHPETNNIQVVVDPGLPSVSLEAGPSGSVYGVKIFNRRRTADGQALEVASTSRYPLRSAA